MSSEIVRATCSATGQVTADGTIVVDAVVQSLGKKASAGVLLLRGENADYITSSASDIKDLITSLVAIIEKVVLIATGIDAASNSPGGQTANIAALTVLKTTLDQSKETLK